MSDQKNTITPEPLIPDHVAANYRTLLADENRNLTPARLAKQADAAGDKALAAWARSAAARNGEDTTPVDATPDLAKAQRAADNAADETHQKSTAEVPAVAPQVGVDEPVDYDAKTVEQLKQLAAERGIDQSGLSLKADYVAALELADEE